MLRLPHIDLKKIARSHWSLVFGLIAGIVCGFFFKDYGNSLQPYAQMYINLLQLSVIPVIVMTVTSSISRITAHPESRAKIWRISSSMFFLLIISSSFASLVGYISAPGEGLSKNPEIASLIADAVDSGGVKEVTIEEEINIEIDPNMIKFFLDSVPNNIFAALSEGAVLKIIIFSIILGVALGIKQAQDGVNRGKAFETLIPVFTLINDGVLAFLPLGIFFLLASQLGAFNLSTIFALTKLVIALCATMTTLIIFFVIIIWICSKKTLSEVLRAMSFLTLMAITTRSAFACIPSCIEGMSKFFDKDSTSIIIPFGNTTCRYGSIVFYSIGSIFIANIFVTQLSVYGYMIIIFSSILASFAASGAVGIVTLQMIAVVLDPLGLPLGTILALFVAIDPIVDIFDTVANVYGNCAAAALSSRRSSVASKISADPASAGI